jgi:outer membrane protein assembly factor BamD (BamD/ComL family)
MVVGPDDLYRKAEAALAQRDRRAADGLLARLVAQHPQSALVEQALYDRARIAYQQRSWSAARKHLDQLLALPAPRLVEQARYLECRIAVNTQDNGAAACLDAYRRAYPRSPHGADVLAMLVQLEHSAGGCPRAAARIDQLVQQHPASKLARAWRVRCEASR